MNPDPLETARQMWADDPASRALGMELRDLGAGVAVVAMTVRADMVNGYAVAHGGLVAALADSAFALACNSRGARTVAAGEGSSPNPAIAEKVTHSIRTDEHGPEKAFGKIRFAEQLLD